VVTVDHGLELSAEQFFKCQNQIPTPAGGADGRGVHLLRGKSAGAHQEIDFYLNAVGPVRMIREIEVPLPQRVVVDAVLKPVAETGNDVLDSFSDFRALAERCFAVDVADVVQVDIDGQPREIQVKEVESRSALEDKLSPEIGMFCGIRLAARGGGEPSRDFQRESVCWWRVRGFVRM
jgi:hypothetical protein